VKIYEQHFDIWAQTKNTMWRSSKTELKTRERTLECLLTITLIFLLILFLGLCLSIILEAEEYKVGCFISLLGALFVQTILLTQDKVLQRQVNNYKESFDLAIFDSITGNLGMTLASWKLVLDSARSDRESIVNKYTYIKQTALTLFTAIIVSAAVTNLLNATQMLSSTTAHVVFVIGIGLLVAFSFLFVWTTGATYEQLCTPRKRVMIDRFIAFIELGLYQEQIKRAGMDNIRMQNDAYRE